MAVFLLSCLLLCVDFGSAIVGSSDESLSEGRYCDASDGSLGSCVMQAECSSDGNATEEKCSSPLVCCPPQGVISRRKCQEYSEIETSSTCPGGQITNVEAKEFPYMAVVGYSTIRDNKWLCGGTLISEKVVLTAGNCGNSRSDGPPRRVRLGDLQNTDEERLHVQQITVAKVIIHPKYNSRLKVNDIALLILSKEAILTTHVRPACLYTKKDLPSSSGVAIGWGAVAFSEGGSNTLLKVKLPFVTYKKCNELYSSRKNISDEEILCAGDIGRDTCQGDSGGPLLVRNNGPGCMADIVGITSFGVACGFNIPGVYTRVSHFVPWIESVIWN